MSHTVYATFAHPEEAEKAAGALLTEGVRPDDLSVVKQPEQNASNATEPRTTASNVLLNSSVADPTSASHGSVYGVPSSERTGEQTSDAFTKDRDETRHTLDSIPPEAATGAKQGGLIGAGIGAVAAIAALIIPGVGFVLGAGALASAIAGVAATAGAGAAAGAIVGYLKENGVDEDVALDYAGTVDQGGAVLAVTLPSGTVDEERGLSILAEHKASNVNRYAARGYVA